MAITDKILIPSRNLAGNPIIAKLYAGADTLRRWRITRVILTDPFYEVIYEGTVYTKLDMYAEIRISDIFEELQHIAGTQKFTLQLAVNDTNYTGAELETITVYGGAISKLLSRKLFNGNTDVFGWKLKNIENNFLLTTRTNTRTIFIPENELLPIGYYAKDMSFKIMANNALVESRNEVLTDDALRTIDFDTIRRKVLDTTGKLTNVFNILSSTDEESCSVIITEAANTTPYFIRFRNSWGVDEMIALNGVISFAPSPSETTKVAVWDQSINDFVSKANRTEISIILNASVGYRSEAERLFLLDMLHSNERTFIVNDEEYTVHVTADLSTLISTDSAPIDVALALEFIDKETSFSDLSFIEINNTDNNHFEYKLPFNLG
jgi:hypothetical protein